MPCSNEIASLPFLLYLKCSNEKYKLFNEKKQSVENITTFFSMFEGRPSPIAFEKTYSFLVYVAYSGTARRWQILRDGFDSWLEPIAFDTGIHRVIADSKSASSLCSLSQSLLTFLFTII